MKLTIRKTLLFSLVIFAILALAALAVMFLRVNRTVIVDGVFTYRESQPVTIEENGFVERLLVRKDSRIEAGDVLLEMSNPDLDIEIADTERQITIDTLELEQLQNTDELQLFAAELAVLSLESRLQTKMAELAHYENLHEINREMRGSGSITKEQLNTSLLSLRTVQGAVAETEFQLRSNQNTLDALRNGAGTAYAVKITSVESRKAHLERLRARHAQLQVRAPAAGVLLSADWDTLRSTFLSKGTAVGEVVSFDDINFSGAARDTDIIRIKKGQRAYFDVELFRRKVFVNGIVTDIGYGAAPGPSGFNVFPIEIEIENKKFIDRDQEFYIQAGVRGQAVIIVEEELSLMALVWEKIVDFADFGVYTE